MVKWLKRIVIALLALVALVVIVGLFLPSGYLVERSVVIDAPPAVIHGIVGDLEQWPVWQPWTEVDPTIEVTLGDRTTGVGAQQSWTGESGEGELTFTASDPATGVRYDLSFDEGAYASVGNVSYEAAADGTRVSWTMQGDSGLNIIGRFFGLFMDGWVGPNFERGLEKLKDAAESAAAQPPPAELPEEQPSEPAQG